MSGLKQDQHNKGYFEPTLTTFAGAGGGGGGEEAGDEASPCPTTLSLSTSLPPSPSSWQKVGRRLAFLPTNLIARVDTVDGGGGGGGGGGTGAVPALAATREAWCAAARAFERAFAAGPLWRRRRRWRRLPAPEWPGAGVEEEDGVQAVCR